MLKGANHRKTPLDESNNMDYGKLYDEHVATTYDEDALGLLSGVRSLAMAQIGASDLPNAPTILDLGVATAVCWWSLPRCGRARG